MFLSMPNESKRRQTPSSLTRYLHDIGSTPLLTAKEEQQLAHLIQDHRDEAARKRLIKSNLRLVVSIAKRYVPTHDAETLLDLIQDGNIGLVKAADRFRPERKTRFSTYAVYWIRQAILRGLKARRLVRLPENVADQVLGMQRTRHALAQVLGRDPTREELAQELHMTLPTLMRLEEADLDIVSLDQTIFSKEGDEPGSLRDVLEDEQAPQPHQVAHSKLVRGVVVSAVRTLPGREKKILEMRFGLGTEEPHTLEDIGHKFGISRERVRQLQNNALDRLRQRSTLVSAAY
jgi:RNA polymerase primary sigma factor